MQRDVTSFMPGESVLGEWALSMVGVEEGREFRFRGDLYSPESTFPLVYFTFYLLIWGVRTHPRSPLPTGLLEGLNC